MNTNVFVVFQLLNESLFNKYDIFNLYLVFHLKFLLYNILGYCFLQNN